jgi:hypothetical protein
MKVRVTVEYNPQWTEAAVERLGTAELLKLERTYWREAISDALERTGIVQLNQEKDVKFELIE